MRVSIEAIADKKGVTIINGNVRTVAYDEQVKLGGGHIYFKPPKDGRCEVVRITGTKKQKVIDSARIGYRYRVTADSIWQMD